MTSFAHLLGGYIIYKVVESQTQNLSNDLVLGLALFGAFVPDVDGFFGNKFNNHRYTVFHAPLFWLTLLILIFALGKILNNLLIQEGVVIFGMGIFSHLFLDWISARTCGIMLFYPFLKKPYSLFPLKPEMGDIPVFPNKSHLKFWKFFLENKILVGAEVGVILLGLVILLLS